MFFAICQNLSAPGPHRRTPKLSEDGTPKSFLLRGGFIIAPPLLPRSGTRNSKKNLGPPSLDDPDPLAVVRALDWPPEVLTCATTQLPPRSTITLVTSLSLPTPILRPCPRNELSTGPDGPSPLSGPAAGTVLPTFSGSFREELLTSESATPSKNRGGGRELDPDRAMVLLHNPTTNSTGIAPYTHNYILKSGAKSKPNSLRSVSFVPLNADGPVWRRRTTRSERRFLRSLTGCFSTISQEIA